MSEITLAQGAGGTQSTQLIREYILRHFDSPELARMEDSAFISGGRMALSTDSYVISPRSFPGGDIGKLSICGTCNDLAVMGARPAYLSCGFIIEEGFSLSEFDRILGSMAAELRINSARIVTGDTKVVPRGAADGIYINTTGVGLVQYTGLSSANLGPQMSIVVSGPIGNHGAALYAQREDLQLETDLHSDCRSLWPSIEGLLSISSALVAMRDATRGGLAGVLHEWAQASNVGIVLDEERIPVERPVQGLCELMGFEPWHLANEGTFVIAVHPLEAAKVVDILKRTGKCPHAAIIGQVHKAHPGTLSLRNAWGALRQVRPPSGELLPRIC